MREPAKVDRKSKKLAYLEKFGLYRFHLPLAAHCGTQNTAMYIISYLISRWFICLKQIMTSTGALAVALPVSQHLSQPGDAHSRCC